jgi:prepilin-type N-terminal cleavage/methylation domain-containing protein
MNGQRSGAKVGRIYQGVAQSGGFTLVELMIVVGVIAVISAIAVPRLTEARVTANEGAAIASLRTLHAAQASFAATCGGGGYAQTLDDLAKPPLDGSAAFLVPPFTANGAMISGYVANVTAGAGATNVLAGGSTCNGAAAATVSSFMAERHPIMIGYTGHRSFAVTDAGGIYFRADGATIVTLAGASPLD